MWDLDQKLNRGPNPTVTLDRIIATAIQVADADGLEALSIRRVAESLDVGTMSLYRYVPGKAELFELMFDRVSATRPVRRQPRRRLAHRHGDAGPRHPGRRRPVTDLPAERPTDFDLSSCGLLFAQAGQSSASLSRQRE